MATSSPVEIFVPIKKNQNSCGKLQKILGKLCKFFFLVYKNRLFYN